MFRLAIAVLAVIGLVSLFSSASGAAAGVGFLVLLPLLLLAKLVFFGMLLGFFGRGFARRRPTGVNSPWGTWRRPDRKEDDKPSRESDFEAWHRMAHAKEEVDSWLEDVD